MGHLVQDPDAQKHLGVVLEHIIKLNNLLCRAASKPQAAATNLCATDLILSPWNAHKIVDANVLDEESCLSESDIDLLMLIGEGLTRQQISLEVGWDLAQICLWQEEIVRKARLSEVKT
jgi:hypothetical protein